MREPKGKITIVKAEIVKQNKAGVYWRTTFQNEKGRLFRDEAGMRKTICR